MTANTFFAKAGMGQKTTARALVAKDGFSARYDLDRLRGVFSRPEHKLAGHSYVGRVLVLDALRFKPHPGHFNLEEALDVVSRLQPAQAYFTHMSHEIEHEAVNRMLPKGVELAYDGLTFEF